MRAVDGRGGGKCRVECENMRDVGRANWTWGRIGGIGLICGERCDNEEMGGMRSILQEQRNRGLADMI